MFDEIEIGNQTWMQRDLHVTLFRNGDPIAFVSEDQDWKKLTTAAYCIARNGSILYTWYAVIDERGLAPEGWHVPTNNEWAKLIKTLGGWEVAGKAMKTSTWFGTNYSGFSAHPSGTRNAHGQYELEDYAGFWWSTSVFGPAFAWYCRILTEEDYVDQDYQFLCCGFSVRCLRDE